MTRLLSAILAASAVALSAILVEARDDEGYTYVASRPAEGEATGQKEIQLGSDFQLAHEELFEDFVDRPLFNISRRPFEPPPVEADGDFQPVALRSGVKRQTANVHLTAIIIHGDDRFVVLHERGAGVGSVVRVGGTVSGWVLQEVRPDGITLAQGDGTHDIALRTFEPPPQQIQKKASKRAKANNAVVAKLTKVRNNTDTND